jgi:hypothetical protein
MIFEGLNTCRKGWGLALVAQNQFATDSLSGISFLLSLERRHPKK